MPRSPKAHALPQGILCGILLGVLALSGGAHAKNEVEKLTHSAGMEEPYTVISPTRAPWEWRRILSPLGATARLRFGTSSGSGRTGSGSSRRLLEAAGKTVSKGKMKTLGGTQRKHARQIGQMRGNQSPKHRERKRLRGKARKGTQS